MFNVQRHLSLTSGKRARKAAVDVETNICEQQPAAVANERERKSCVIIVYVESASVHFKLKTRKCRQYIQNLTELDLVKLRFSFHQSESDISIKFIQQAMCANIKIRNTKSYEVYIELAERVHPDRRSFPLT